MKPSGVDWIGDIPVDWDILRIKSACKNSDTTNSAVDKYVGLEHVTSWAGSYTSVGLKDVNPTTFQTIKKNTFCFSKLRPYLAKGFFSHEPLAISTEFLTYTLSNRVNADYFVYFSLSVAFIEAINNIAGGAKMPRINGDTFENQLFSQPSLKEQIAIAAYLDDRTKAIDSKIQLLEEKSTALAELRKSVIHQAVTKGLDPNVAMKPSGVDWIGDIPVHWNNSRVKKVVEIIKGKKPHLFIETTPSRQCYLSARVIRGTEEPQYVELTDPQAVKATKNDILIIMDGSNSGEVFTGVEGIVSSTMGCLKYKTGITKTMLMYLLDLLFESFNSETVGAAIPHLNKNTFYDASLALPSIDEQQVITNYLDERTSVIDESIKTITEQIAALKDLRQSLIYEAVTGKIDVADYGYATM